jgi:hypothetical protein
MKSTTLLLISLLILSCGDNDDYKLSSEQLYNRAVAAASDNNQIITSAEEIIDLTADVLSDEGISTARSSSGRWSSSARSCTPSVNPSYLIDRSHYDTTLYIGTMTIDYGNGSDCPDNQYKRAGKIIDDFEFILNYKNEIYWSKETITFDSFQKDSVKIDGTFSIYSKTGDDVTMETSKATITYNSGKTAVWKGTLNFRPVRKDGQSISNTISGSFSGITKRSEKFETTIIEPIQYNYDCKNLDNPIPVKGVIQMDVLKERSSIDYGDGTCDQAYTLFVNDKQTQHGL